MKKLFLLSILLLSGIFTYAQEETVVEVQSKRGPYVTNRFFDNVFISVGGGAQVYFGEYDKKGDFGKRIAPALDISLGKWITPSVGVRLQYAGLKANAWQWNESVYADSREDNMYREKFNVLNLHADMLWNISNAISGYKETRFWDFVPFAGFGWARSKANGAKDNEISVNLGLLNVLRLSKSLDLNLEGRLMIVNQRFDGVVGGRKMEGLASLTAGLTYNFPVRGFKRTSDIIVVDDNSEFINKIGDLERQLAAAEAARAALKKELDDERAKGPKVVSDPYAVLSDFAIFFTIGKADVSKKEKINLEYIAKAMKELPDEKFILFASADKQTGTAEFNQKLSEKRGQVVYDILTKEYGVNPDQLEIKAVGSSDQVFDKAAYNRVVIIREK